MKKKMVRVIAFILLAAIVMTSILALVGTSVSAYTKKEAVILDVDMCGDVDDIMAIRMMENYDTIGKIDLLAVTSTVKGNEKAIAGLLTKDGHENVPVGISPYSTDTTAAPYYAKFEETAASNEMMDAVKLMRKILAESKEKVSIVTTGYLTNLYGLMISQADEYSELSGTELIKKKVKEVHVTGGSYPDGFDNNYGYVPFAGVSANYVFKNWDGNIPFVVYTNDLGGSIKCGSSVAGDSEDYLGWALADRGVQAGSPSWDAFTAFAFVNLSDSKIHGIKYAKCEMSVNTDGSDTITDTKTGRFYRIIKTHGDEYYKNIINGNLILI